MEMGEQSTRYPSIGSYVFPAFYVHFWFMFYQGQLKAVPELLVYVLALVVFFVLQANMLHFLLT